MRRPAVLRVVATLLTVVSLGWLWLLVFSDFFPEPDTAPIILLYAFMVLLPPVGYLLLMALLRWLVRSVDPPKAQRLRIRRAVWIAGPLGCAWAVFRLTSGH